MTQTINGTNGNDTINGTNKGDTIYAKGGNDTVNGGNGDDFIDAGSGNDTVNAGNGDDEVYGGTGNDTIDGGNGDDELDGDSGNDTINGGNGDDQIAGDSGDDILKGGAGNDLISGGDGNDTITGGTGNDLIYGGAGTDTAIFAGTYASYDILHILGLVLINGQDGTDLVRDVEYLKFDNGTYNVATHVFTPNTPPPLPLVSVIATDGVGTEAVDGTDFTFTFSRTGDLSQALTVNYSIFPAPVDGADTRRGLPGADRDDHLRSRQQHRGAAVQRDRRCDRGEHRAVLGRGRRRRGLSGRHSERDGGRLDHRQRCLPAGRGVADAGNRRDHRRRFAHLHVHAQRRQPRRAAHHQLRRQ